ELESDLGLPPAPHGDLSAWQDQGVLLLNRVLTVAPGAPAPHRGRGWEAITELAIRSLVERGAPLWPGRWGVTAQSRWRCLGGGPITELAIRSLVEGGARWWRCCGGVTRSRWCRCSARCPMWPAPIPARCRPPAASSGPGPSPGSTSCWRSREPPAWTGGSNQT